MFDREEDNKRLHRIFAGNRISHAYMITGPGRESFARGMAAAMVCDGEMRPCGRCIHCKKAAVGVHPDIQLCSPEEGKREITVDQVRRLRTDAYVRPNEAGKKVYLIDPASALNTNAQNALLKVLEEGPAYAAFLLLSERAGALLPTVRSRCEEISLFSVEKEEVPQNERGEKLVDLLLAGKEAALLAYCVELEKTSREELQDLLQAAMQILGDRVKQDPCSAGKILPVVDRLHKLWEAAQYNTGVGHLLGWLCASSFS